MKAPPPVTIPESYALSIGKDGSVTGFVVEIDRARCVVWIPLASGWRVDSIGPDETLDTLVLLGS